MKQDFNYDDDLLSFVISMADSALILSHRLSEWCGYGPVLEQDIALSNISLDLIGEARNFYDYAVTLEGSGKTEDDLAYFRDSHEFKNVLIAELPNGNFADTIMRQFLFDTYHYYFLSGLKSSKNEQLVSIAEKSLKEVSYHVKWSAEWVVRLGDGTDLSHEKIVAALDEVWHYSGELTTPTEIEKRLAEQHIIPDLTAIKQQWESHVKEVFARATIEFPSDKNDYQIGGKTGKHTEHLSYILAEMQSVQRAYPGLNW